MAAVRNVAFNSNCIRRFLAVAGYSSLSLIPNHRSSSNFRLTQVPRCFDRPIGLQRCGVVLIHSGRILRNVEHEQVGKSDIGTSESPPKKRKKLKGKRAVVRWLKFFRWKKKRDFQRMTPEEKILFKLTKARKKEQRLLEAMKKIEPKETSVTAHDPEILTPEEHFYYLKMGEKCKNYVPVGRRGIYKGVILNMHLHWKKHETLKVFVKTFSASEVREIAVELARLSGGIVLDIQEEDTIIMYRGKNYSQPPTEIMSPRSTLSRKKALDKSKYRDALRAVQRYIPRLEQELELLKAQAETPLFVTKNEETQSSDITNDRDFEGSDQLRELLARGRVDDEQFDDDDPVDTGSDSDALSDSFETDSGSENEAVARRSPFLDAMDKIPMRMEEDEGEEDDFEELLRRVSADSRKERTSLEEDVQLSDFDAMILEAASLLKKKKKKR